MMWSINQSINQSNLIAPCFASESEARVGGVYIGGVFTFSVSNVKQFCLSKSLENTEKFSRSTNCMTVSSRLEGRWRKRQNAFADNVSGIRGTVQQVTNAHCQRRTFHVWSWHLCPVIMASAQKMDRGRQPQAGRCLVWDFTRSCWCRSRRHLGWSKEETEVLSFVSSYRPIWNWKLKLNDFRKKSTHIGEIIVVL